MRAFRRMLEEAARSDVPVLLVGEPGTGKKTYAGALHAASPRAGRRFVRVDCAAGVADLRPHAAAALGGTLFLDEVAELSSAAQAAALKLLDEAASNPERPEVRIVASSARDLPAALARGSFRRDLFYRLAVVELRIPPLRERGEDVLPMARARLAELAARARRPLPELTPEVEHLLVSYRWPGNVTELESVLERMVLLSPGPVLSADALPPRLRG